MVDQNPVTLGYLRSIDIPGRFEGMAEANVQFGLLAKHSHEACRGDVLIPRGSVLSISALYDGAAYLLECRAPGTSSRRDDIMLCKLWQVEGDNSRFYGTTHVCLSGPIRVPRDSGFNLYRNRANFGLTVSRRPGR